MRLLLQRILGIALAALAFCVPSVRSDVFSSVPVSFPAVSNACAAWGDFDNDGRLDLLIAGNTGSNRVTQIWRNTGSGFTELSAGLPGVDFGSVAWGDFDNDGHLDLILSGNSGFSRITQLWRNTGAGFVLVSTNFPGVDRGSVAWGDYDNDGKLDVLITGQTNASGSGVTLLFRNIGNGFTNLSASLPGLTSSSVAWGDYDNDGRADILISGYSGAGLTRIFHNTQAGIVDSGFISSSSAGAVAWGDFDNDGKLDALRNARLYRNTGTNFLQVADFSFITNGTTAWGDFDNDGRLDFLVTGSRGSDRFAQIWRNTPTGFLIESLNIPGVDSSAAVWGDYDNDGRLDFLLLGSTGSNQIAQLWHNTTPLSNSQPSPPSSLTNDRNGYEVHLYWNAGTDEETPSAGLTYNLRVGTTTGAIDVVSPHSTSTGQRLVVQIGNRGAALSAALTNLPLGRYYWSVQAIDSSFAGSVFSPESTFDVVALPPYAITLGTTPTVSNAVLRASVNANGIATQVYFEYGVSTNYGQTTSLTNIGSGYDPILVTNPITGLTLGASYHYRVVAWNSAGTNIGADAEFTVPIFANLNVGLPDVFLTAAAWGDFDGDGRLDILIAGRTATRLTQIWRNTGSGFTNINAGLPGIDSGSAAWGDYDNDGRLDLLLSGNSDTGPITQVWRNTGLGFSNINAGLPGVQGGTVSWGDYDNDGKLDILLTGLTNSVTSIAQVWRNTGRGSFTNSNIVLPGVFSGITRWIDYDNDGWLDILFVGNTNSNQSFAQLWRNTGNGFSNVDIGLPGSLYYFCGAFADYDSDGQLDLFLSARDSVGYSQIWRRNGSILVKVETDLPGFVTNPSAAWGDYDNDGRSDVLASGQLNSTNGQVLRRAYVFRNTGSTFQRTDVGLLGVTSGTVAWGDYDSDGKLDVVLGGNTGSTGEQITRIAQVWRNLSPKSNSPPTAPGGLVAEPGSLRANLRWDAGSDTETATPGLSYNLRVSTTPGGFDIVSPHSASSGFRFVPEIGNRQMARSAIVNNLVPGTYYWSVQTIDSAFAGSPFAPEQTFVITPVILQIALKGTNQIYLQFRGRPGAGYTVRSSADLTTWGNLRSLIAGNDGIFDDIEDIEPGVGARFYRLREP